MCCLESDQIRQSITTDWKAAQVHVLPMMQLNFKVRIGAAVVRHLFHHLTVMEDTVEIAV